MRIATWNVNSIRQREQHVARWLDRAEPDVLLLQEIKCESHAFPALTYHGLGYQAEAVGQTLKSPRMASGLSSANSASACAASASIQASL